MRCRPAFLLLPFLVASLIGCAIPKTSSHRPPGVLQDSNFDGTVVPGRYVVVFDDATPHADLAHGNIAKTSASVRTLSRLHMAAVRFNSVDDGKAMQMLAAQPGVAFVLHDRTVSAHSLQVAHMVPNLPVIPPVLKPFTNVDADYAGPQGWAVRQAGGYGHNIGGPAHGPWDTTMGRGVRIAVLDSGVDAAHPDIAPNLALNLSEIDAAALPSVCDDGSPFDQQGHGTWTASLAAAAAGAGTGSVVGVAPQASLLNIKVLQRMPAVHGATPTARCEAGEASGLLSWVLAGIDDAVAARADVISLSLGTLVSLDSGEGAGWRAAFDQATHAATLSGAVIIAALGNDSVDLSEGEYIELPAQSRDVLAVVASTNPACAENNSPNAVCVAGSITRASYSSFGAVGAVAAPGGALPNVSETGVNGWVRGACSSGRAGTVDGLPTAGRSFGCFGNGHAAYVQAMGTSASAALTAGVAALVRAAHPDWTPAQIITALQSGAAMQSNAALASSIEEPQVNAATALAAKF